MTRKLHEMAQGKKDYRGIETDQTQHQIATLERSFVKYNRDIV